MINLALSDKGTNFLAYIVLFPKVSYLNVPECINCCEPKDQS